MKLQAVLATVVHLPGKALQCHDQGFFLVLYPNGVAAVHKALNSVIQPFKFVAWSIFDRSVMDGVY